MATVTSTGRYATGTLTAGDGNGDTVTLGRGYAYVEVTVRTDVGATSGYVKFTVDTGPNDEQQITPTLAGPDGYPVGYGATRTVRDDSGGNRQGAAPPTTVRIVGSTALAYWVVGVDTP